MRIGVVSDTHNNLRNVKRIVELFNELKVDRVVHTGDITQAKTIQAFSDLVAPMAGVFGNNDQERPTLQAAIDEHGFEFFEPPYVCNWYGRRIIIVHDPLEFVGHLNSEHDLALHGHTHRYREEIENSTLIYNPGECAGMMKGFNAIGVVDLATLTTERIKF